MATPTAVVSNLDEWCAANKLRDECHHEASVSSAVCLRWLRGRRCVRCAPTQFSLELVELDGLGVSPVALIQDNGMPCLLAVRLDLVAIQMKNCSAWGTSFKKE